ncbi:MAG TPA: hypothetical protein VLB68_18520 [Pyrinomonadaceae bacterium]|nr:hypothetical protein [Pyrinomonadaceae bacterium]
MTLRFTVVLLILVCVGVLGMASTITGFAIVEAVNTKLQPGDQLNPIGWSLPKTLRLHNQYRSLYPEGRLLWRQGVLTSAMLFCLLLAGGVLGFPILPIAFFGGIGALLLWFVYFKH